VPACESGLVGGEVGLDLPAGARVIADIAAVPITRTVMSSALIAALAGRG
jgi:hypothetical protein